MSLELDLAPLDATLVGTPVEKEDSTPLSVQHIVPGFDPCMVHTVL